MTEVRQSLARAISALADEVEGLEESIRPARRLGQLGLDLAALDREIAELTETHRARLPRHGRGGLAASEPIVRRLQAGGRWIRTIGTA